MAAPRVVVAGALANKPGNGGEAWVRLSWIRGFAQLGCHVAFLEEIDGDSFVDGLGGPTAPSSSVNLRWFQSIVDRFGLTRSSALVSEEGEVIAGLPRTEIDDVLRRADLLVNISGNLRFPSLRDVCPLRVYIDLDPGFTQLWSVAGTPGARLDGHHRYFTVGSNLGRDDCPIPTNGIEWRHVPPPVVLGDWPLADGSEESAVTDSSSAFRFTSVGTWRGPYGPIEVGGRRLGNRAHELRRFMELPGHLEATVEVALAIDPRETKDLDLLQAHHWQLQDPRTVAASPEAFRSYVSGSSAEFAVAQEMYVATSSGWFSDRTTRYLASGRPALVQDTGFSATLPTGKGLVAFSTLEDAILGARDIVDEYPAHAAAARQLVREYFDSDLVLSRFLDNCGIR